MRISRGTVAAIAAAIGLLSAGMPGARIEAQAQEAFPSRGVKIIVPFAAGSVLDTLARIVADGTARKWGQWVVVENVVGGGGNTGTAQFARSPPDGYTLLAAPPGPFTMNRLLYKDLGYDAAKFVPISLMGTVPTVLVARNTLPAKSFKEYVELARASPGKLSYASQGVGSTPFLFAKLLETKAGVQIVHVPYRGSAPALNDIVAGHIDSMFDAISNVLPLIRGEKMRALAITDKVRSPLLPDVPTMSDVVPGFSALSWFALAAPPGTPAQLADRIGADVGAIFAQPAVSSRLREIGLTPVGSSPKETVQFIANEDAMWANLIRDLGLKPQ